MFVAECLLHVHQQVLHRDIFTLIQHVGPFAQVPTETGEDMGVNTSLIVLLKEGIYIEVPEHVSSIYRRHIEHFFAFFAGNTVFSLVSELPRRL